MLIAYYSEDPAAQTMVSELLKLGEWRKEGDFFVHGEYHLVEIGEKIAEMRKFEARKFGDFSSLLILSRHASKSGNRVITTHFTGNISRDELSVSRPAPAMQLSLMRTLREFAPPDYPLTLECTHHGPYETDVPSLFIEIGSTEEEWMDRRAARAIALSIMNMRIEEPPIVCVGFGGGHYAPRQTQLLLNHNIAFAHIIPNHRIAELTRENVRRIFEISETEIFYADRKSMKGELRKRLAEVTEGYIGISEGNLMFQPRAEIYREIVKVISDPVLTENVNETPMEFHELSRELFEIAMSVNAEETRRILSTHCGAYSRDGSILMCSQDDFEEVARRLIELLSTRYSIRVDETRRSLILERSDKRGKVINSRRSKEVRVRKELMEILRKVEI